MFINKFQKTVIILAIIVCTSAYTTKHITEQNFKNVSGHAVAQLVEALRYKSEGRGFDSRWCDCNFSLTHSSRPHYGSGVDSASNINEYQAYILGVKAAGA